MFFPCGHLAWPVLSLCFITARVWKISSCESLELYLPDRYWIVSCFFPCGHLAWPVLSLRFITALVSEKFHRVNLWNCICLTDIELLAPFVFHHGRLKRLNSYIELRVTAMLTFCHQRWTSNLYDLENSLVHHVVNWPNDISVTLWLTISFRRRWWIHLFSLINLSAYESCSIKEHGNKPSCPAVGRGQPSASILSS